MGDVVNLKRVRKDKARVAADAKASANRAKFGRKKADKKLAQTEAEAAERKLDGHRREHDDYDH
ncbi:MAG: DUF4169 family protein [Hyphomonadaceae bacterium]